MSTAKTFADRVFEAASDALTYKPAGPALNGKPLFSGIARCPVCLEYTDIELPCCNGEPQEESE